MGSPVTHGVWLVIRHSLADVGGWTIIYFPSHEAQCNGMFSSRNLPRVTSAWA